MALGCYFLLQLLLQVAPLQVLHHHPLAALGKREELVAAHPLLALHHRLGQQMVDQLVAIVQHVVLRVVEQRARLANVLGHLVERRRFEDPLLVDRFDKRHVLLDVLVDVVHKHFCE